MGIFKRKKLILQLCADTGSDTVPYKNDPRYEVMLVGKDIGVENYHVNRKVYGIIANPVCLEFSTARTGGRARNPEAGMFLVNECLRIIDEAKAKGGLKFWVIENPARGALSDYLGKPQFTYQPYQFGSPWTKHTALWGEFNKPAKKYAKWSEVPEADKIPELYVRPDRTYKNGTTRKSSGIPSLAIQHKSAFRFIPEFAHLPAPDSDMEIRSLCSQRFARAFYEVNQ